MSQTNFKVPWFEYLYFFMIVIYAGMAIKFTQQMVGYQHQPIGFIIPILMTVILIVRNNTAFHDFASLIFAIIVITAWLFLQFAKNSYFNVSYTFFIFYALFIAYIIVKVYKNAMFFLYERIVTYLSLVAIIGWAVMVVAPNLLAHFIDAIKMPHSESSIIRGNILIFSMTNPSTYAAQQVWGLTRNSGFSWEPGRFASLVVVALFFNMARTQFQFKKNISFWILLLALITTQSTTGYISTSILILFFMINQKKVSKIFYLLLIIPLSLTIYELPFVGEKINTLLNIEQPMSKSLHDLRQVEREQYIPQRFDGMAFEYLNIVNDPILGYGLEVKNSYVNKNISQALVLSNGFLKVIARFGLIMAGLFFFLLYKSSKYIVKLYSLKGEILYMALYVLISTSYDFILVPFFLSTVMYYLFSEKKLYRVHKQEISRQSV